MIVSNLSAQVNDLLRPMGITRNVSAYSILLRCIELIYEQEDRLQAVEKEIYTPIADQRCCDPKAIQSAIRRATKTAWDTNPACAAAGRLPADRCAQRGAVSGNAVQRGGESSLKI